ncbi:hypothetical protein D3C83_83310 [compost metagenome]
MVLGIGAQEHRAQHLLLEHAVGLHHAKAAVESEHLFQPGRRAHEVLQAAGQAGGGCFFSRR